MVFGILDALRPLDAKIPQVVAKVGKRLVVQQPGQIIGCKRKTLTAPDANEQAHIFVADLVTGQLAGKGGENTCLLYTSPSPRDS